MATAEQPLGRRLAPLLRLYPEHRVQVGLREPARAIRVELAELIDEWPHLAHLDDPQLEEHADHELELRQALPAPLSVGPERNGGREALVQQLLVEPAAELRHLGKQVPALLPELVDGGDEVADDADGDHDVEHRPQLAAVAGDAHVPVAHGRGGDDAVVYRLVIGPLLESQEDRRTRGLKHDGDKEQRQHVLEVVDSPVTGHVIVDRAVTVQVDGLLWKPRLQQLPAPVIQGVDEAAHA
mmetsp:Transcript_66066/g.196591  ORF Transcript_66066/g.196591 Transcript_66066/m.196591 type:complete len:240 (+) Transcript_66066:116-835(+)